MNCWGSQTHPNLRVVRNIVLILIFTFSFSGCELLMHPPMHIKAIPTINSDGEIVFTYQKNISVYSYFERENYIVTSVSLTEYSCKGNDCYPTAWEISLPRNPKNIYKSFLTNHTSYFPIQIVYGKTINDYEVVNNPKKLKNDVPYHLIIGLHGFDENETNDVYFSAESYFMLEDDGIKSKQKLLVWGKDGVKFDLKAK